MARITLDLTEEIDDKLNDIARRSGISKAEAIRRAFALLSIADAEENKGNFLAVLKEGPNNTLQPITRLVGIL